MSEELVGQEVRRMVRDQHDRLSGLLADFVQKHGPIDPQVMEEVRQEWLAAEQRRPSAPGVDDHLVEPEVTRDEIIGGN